MPSRYGSGTNSVGCGETVAFLLDVKKSGGLQG